MSMPYGHFYCFSRSPIKPFYQYVIYSKLHSNDLRAATDALFSVRLQRVVELSPTAAQVWSFNQDLWEGKGRKRQDNPGGKMNSLEM